MISRLFMVVVAITLASQPARADFSENGADGKLEWQVVRKFNTTGKPVDIAHSLDGKYAFVLTDQSVISVYDQRGALQGKIPVEAGVNAITIDPMGKFLHLSDSTSKTFYTLALDFVLNINTAKAPIKGDANAPVTIAVFSDFQ
jgi:hypothetical protein